MRMPHAAGGGVRGLRAAIVDFSDRTGDDNRGRCSRFGRFCMPFSLPSETPLSVHLPVPLALHASGRTLDFAHGYVFVNADSSSVHMLSFERYHVRKIACAPGACALLSEKLKPTRWSLLLQPSLTCRACISGMLYILCSLTSRNGATPFLVAACCVAEPGAGGWCE